MTETEPAVDDDAERRRRQGDAGRRSWLPERWPRRLVRDVLDVRLELGLLIAGTGIPYPDFDALVPPKPGRPAPKP